MQVVIEMGSSLFGESYVSFIRDHVFYSDVLERAQPFNLREAIDLVGNVEGVKYKLHPIIWTLVHEDDTVRYITEDKIVFNNARPQIFYSMRGKLQKTWGRACKGNIEFPLKPVFQRVDRLRLDPELDIDKCINLRCNE